VIFVAEDYPEWQKETIEILKQFNFDENGVIQGNHIEKIQTKFSDNKKRAGEANKFAAHILE